MSLFQKHLNFDIFDKVLNYLNVDDILNFMFVEKYVYNIYNVNQKYLGYLISRKVLEYFHFKTVLKTIDDHQFLLNLYISFKLHPYASRTDFLVYMIDQQYESDELFKYFASFCHLNFYDLRHKEFIQVELKKNRTALAMNSSSCSNVRKRADISFSGESTINQCDIKYMIVHSSISQLCIILDIYTISEVILAHSIEDILLLRKDPKNDVKIKMCIDYFLNKKYYIPEVKTMYLHFIITNLIYHKQTSLLTYLLTKNNQLELDYMYLKNKCIEVGNNAYVDIFSKVDTE